MKTARKTKKKNSVHKRRASSKSEIYAPLEKVNSDVKNWRNSVSKRFLSDYAIPFTRLVEAKLISLQSKV